MELLSNRTMTEKQGSDTKLQPWTAPAHAESADAELVLDDATALRVHSALLIVESPVLRDAVMLARKLDGDTLRIPWPSTTAEEAHALIFLLYSSRRESYALGLTLDQLLLLVKVCHQYAFQGLLDLLEQALARHIVEFCSPEAQAAQFLTTENAMKLYWIAHSKGLTIFQAACASYIAANLQQVARAASADAVGPILAAVAPFQCRLQSADNEIRYHQERLSAHGIYTGDEVIVYLEMILSKVRTPT